jgi:competence protein ComEC
VAWVFLTYTIEAVRLVAQIPRASVPVRTESWMVLAYYTLLLGLTWWFRNSRERRREIWGKLRDWLSSNLRTRLLVGASAVLLVLALAAWRSLPDGKLHIFFLDVGQGDAIFIQTPSGRQALIDGGPSPSVLLSQLGRRMPFWDRTLDLVVLTHPDEDHISGLVPVLERYQVDTVVWRELGCQDPICDRWRQLMGEVGATVYNGEAGLAVELDRGLRMEVLHPGAELLIADGYNDNSIVTRLSYGAASVLLTGDVTARAEAVLLASGSPLRSTVLKAGHHGACTSTTAPFLEAVDPELAVISVGADNDYGHPCDDVLERLSGRVVYRTDEHGTVEVVSDGARVWVDTRRSN